MTKTQKMHLENVEFLLNRHTLIANKLANFPADGDHRDKWELCRKCKAIEASFIRYKKAGVATVDLGESAVAWVS